MSNHCLICQTVHDSFQKSWLRTVLSIMFTFFSKLHNLSRLTLVSSFSWNSHKYTFLFVEIKGSTCCLVNCKRPRKLFTKFALGTIKVVDRTNKIMFAFALYFKGPCIHSATATANAVFRPGIV